MESPLQNQKSFMKNVALAWVLESQKAFEQQRVGQGNSKLREGMCEGSGVAFLAGPQGMDRR